MISDIVVDLQYGDCGKGKVTHHLCRTREYTHVIRYNGGCNAGHTIFHKGKKFITHHIPAGVFFGIRSIIGPGCVVNVEQFFKEIEEIVNTHTEDDINNVAFDWGFNCDMDRTPVRNRDIFPYLSKNIDNLANQIGAKLKVQLNEPWINSYKKGQYQETHDHDGHVFSSVIFLNEEVNFAEFYFVDRMIDPTPHSLKKLLNLFMLSKIYKISLGFILYYLNFFMKYVSNFFLDL